MNTTPSASLSTRRQAMTTIAATLTALATGAPMRANAQQMSMTEKPSTSANQNRTSIHYEIEFKPAPQRLYEAILDQKQFAAFSGLPATIDRTPGGAFSQFGGLIVGRNIELVSKQRIVQAWRPTHWEPGIYSIVHFEFNPRAAETTMIFDHNGFPAGEYDHLDSGWQEHYWEPLKKFLA